MLSVHHGNLTAQQFEILSSTPVLQPPNGTLSNFVNPQTRAGLQIWITSTLLVLAMASYLNRVYVKLSLMRRATWDDATLLIAVLSGITYYTASTWGAQKGNMARHLYDINIIQAKSPHLLVPAYIMFVLPPIALVFLKASFFILYLQLFESLRWVRVCCYTGLGAITAVHVTLAVYSFVVASPYHSNWTHKAEMTAVPASVAGLLVDVAILVIPIVAIKRIGTLSKKRKAGAMLIFLTGGLACLCSAFSIDVRHDLKTQDDKTWIDVIVTIATLCELFIGIFCACAPAAAYGFRNSRSIWQRLYSRTQSFRSTIRTDLSENHHGTYDAYPRVDEQVPVADPLRSTDRKYAQYFELNENMHTPQLRPVSPARLASEKRTSAAISQIQDLERG